MAPRDEFVRVDDLDFHVRIWSDVGQSILLVHGLASSARTWDLLAPRLAPRFRVVALDQRGHGESAKPEDGYDLATAVADVRGVAAALGLDRPVLVGHSWGGNVVLQCAVDHPEGLSRLVLLDGGFIEPQLRGGTWEEAEKQMAPPDLRVPLPAFVERLRGRLGPIYSDAVRDAVLANFWVDPRGIIHPRLTRDRHMRLARALWDHRPSLIYEQVTAPTLVIPAETSDPTADPERQRWKHRAVALAEQRLPRGRVLWMHDSIHDVQLQRPDELAAALIQFVTAT
jgi:pimeloyl-ACP methyl ester carboxylesterase